MICEDGTKSEIYQKLAELAKSACGNSYAPYSHFRVGCAVLCGDNIYCGCNIENISYGATNCAERSAVFSAVSNGERKIDILAIAAKNSEDRFANVTPCGICRQVISEFADENTKLILVCENENFNVYKFSDFLPNSFKF